MKKKFRVFDKREGRHYFDNEYSLEGSGELYYYDVVDKIFLSCPQEYFEVQFYTGLTDVSGEEIFEGDWVCWVGHNGQTRKAMVVYSPVVAAFVLDISRRHLIDDKYGEFCFMHRENQYKIVEQ